MGIFGKSIQLTKISSSGSRTTLVINFCQDFWEWVCELDSPETYQKGVNSYTDFVWWKGLTCEYSWWLQRGRTKLNNNSDISLFTQCSNFRYTPDYPQYWKYKPCDWYVMLQCTYFYHNAKFSFETSFTCNLFEWCIHLYVNSLCIRKLSLCVHVRNTLVYSLKFCFEIGFRK